MIRTAKRGDGPAPGRAPAGRDPPRPAAPDLRLSSRAAVLELQRAAGNRAVGLLQRREKDWIRTHSIGAAEIDRWSDDERRGQVAALVAGLQEPGVDAAERETMELNLEALEAWSASRGVELSQAEAFRLQQVVRAAAVDVKSLLALARDMAPEPHTMEAHFAPEVEWAVDQLAWATDRIVAANDAIGSGDPARLRGAGRTLTLAIAVIKAISAHLGFVGVAIQVETQAPHSWTSEMDAQIEAYSGQVRGPIWAIRVRGGAAADQGAADLLAVVPTWRWDFGEFVERMQEHLEKRALLLKIVNIVQLAWLAYDIWALPITGVPGGGEPPTISGPPGGAVAVAGGGVLISAESIAAVRALVAAGVLTNPELIKLVGGSAPPKPMETSRPTPEPPARGGGSGARARPAPDARPAKGLPTLDEDAVVREYTRDLAEFRERREALEAVKAKRPRDKEAIKAAAKAEEETRRKLDAIEARAIKDTGELAEHLDPLTRERDLMKRTGMRGTATGTRIPCEAARTLPPDLRYADFADLEPALGAPTEVDAAAKASGGSLPSGHQRVTWRFKDKSSIVIDVPRKLGGRAASADLPHVEFHGPRGERLDPQGIQIPEGSVAAHVTISDTGNLLELKYLGAARARR